MERGWKRRKDGNYGCHRIIIMEQNWTHEIYEWIHNNWIHNYHGNFAAARAVLGIFVIMA